MSFFAVETLAVPDGDAMPPPQLAADAPILDIFEPVQVHFAPALRVKLDVAITHRGLGFLDARITQPPLPGETRLDRHIGAFGITNVVRVRLFADESTGCPQQFRGFFSTGESVQSRQLRTGQFVERAVGIEHVDNRQLVTLANFEIHLVVRRCDLQRTGSEFLVHRRVGHDRDRPAIERTPDRLADERRITRIVGMHRDRHVARNRFRTRRGDLDKFPGTPGQFIPHLEKRAVDRFHDDLLV